MVAVAVRDPAGTNYSPYTFAEPVAAADQAVTLPINKPVLDHIDVIRGERQRLQDARRGGLLPASGRATRRG